MFKFQYQRELTRLMSSPFKGNLAYAMYNFVEEWRNFVEEVCPSSTERIAPRWAQEGLHFLAMAVHPAFTIYLQNSNFKVTLRSQRLFLVICGGGGFSFINFWCKSLHKFFSLPKF